MTFYRSIGTFPSRNPHGVFVVLFFMEEESLHVVLEHEISIAQGDSL
jgi:hypothetical protein